MTYTINKSDGTLLLNLADQTADTSASSLTLIGRGLVSYGRYECENLIHLLENFSKTTAPANPLVGQFWYDKGNTKMKVWNGTVWLRALLGTDDSNVIPGLTFGAGLTLNSGTLTANTRSVAGRTGDVTLSVSDVSGAAPLASPTFTGAPLAPTASTGDSTTKIATTAFVRAQIAADTLNYGAGNGLTVSGGNLAAVGTTNRITVSNAGIDIASTYAGQNSISTLGNVTSGQWSATTVAVAYGGTGGTTAAGARANLDVLQYNALAASLASVGNGLLINNAGTAVARQIISGTPDTLSVTNGTGVGGDITISLLGGNSGPVPITGGGTGQTTKNAAFNALSPLTTTGDLIIFDSGVHTRLAGKSDTATWFLTSGASDAKPRWTTGIDAATVGTRAPSYLLDRANHTGANNATTLENHPGSYYLDYANFTGNFPSTAVINASSPLASMALGDSGYVKFNGGFTIQWGRTTGYFLDEITYSFTFPVAFTQVFSVTANVIVNASYFQDWFTQILTGSLSTSGFAIQNSHAGDFKGTAHNGWFWMAMGYIA